MIQTTFLFLLKFLPVMVMTSTRFPDIVYPTVARDNMVLTYVYANILVIN